MATGPEHYRAAELAIENAKDAEGGSNKERFFLAVAQVRATLALAAATALASTGVGEADLGEWTALICEPDDPYEGMTNADVMSGEEMAEYDRAAEFAMDAADEERWAEANAANQYDDEHYDVDDEDQGDDEDGEL